MPEHIFTILARGYAVDAQANALTLFHVLESIGAPTLPGAIPDFRIVTLWKREQGEENVDFAQRTVFSGPDGKEIAHWDQSFRLDRPRMRVLGTINMFPIRQVGCHRIEVSVKRADAQDWTAVASYPLEVSSTLDKPDANAPLFEQKRPNGNATASPSAQNEGASP